MVQYWRGGDAQVSSARGDDAQAPSKYVAGIPVLARVGMVECRAPLATAARAPRRPYRFIDVFLRIEIEASARLPTRPFFGLQRQPGLSNASRALGERRKTKHKQQTKKQ